MNYSRHSAAGFSLLAEIFESCFRYRFSYGRLEDAVSAFAALA